VTDGTTFEKILQLSNKEEKEYQNHIEKLRDTLAYPE
jgi:hypothetical protein